MVPAIAFVRGSTKYEGIIAEQENANPALAESLAEDLATFHVTVTGVSFLGSAGLLGSLLVKAFIAADTKFSAMDNTTSNVPYAFNVGYFVSIANKILSWPCNSPYVCEV